MKHIRKNTQLSLLNPKCAGRPAKNDKGIRHIKREIIHRPTSLHLTIKVRENKADIKSKRILKALHHAILRARLKGLRIIHYTLEYNHVHLLVEASENKILQRGMLALGISFSKAINKFKCLKGAVYKHRYHFRKINSSRELKNVLHYIFHNGIHHKRTKSLIDPFNSMPAEKNLCFLYKEAKKIKADINNSDYLKKLKTMLINDVLDVGMIYFKGLEYC